MSSKSGVQPNVGADVQNGHPRPQGLLDERQLAPFINPEGQCARHDRIFRIEHYPGPPILDGARQNRSNRGVRQRFQWPWFQYDGIYELYKTQLRFPLGLKYCSFRLEARMKAFVAFQPDEGSFLGAAGSRVDCRVSRSPTNRRDLLDLAPRAGDLPNTRGESTVTPA